MTQVPSCVQTLDYGLCVLYYVYSLPKQATRCNFQGGKRVKARRPFISTFFFVLLMEYLSRLLKTTSEQQGFRYHPQCKTLQLTHLLFVNDLVLFFKAYPTVLGCMTQAFQKFANYSRLKANLTKSQIMFKGCNPSLQKTYLSIIGFKDGGLPFRYLSQQTGYVSLNVELQQRRCQQE